MRSLVRTLYQTMTSTLFPQQASGAAQTTLTVAIADSVDPAPGNANFDYTVVVTNTGGATADNVSCVVVLDSTVSFVSGSGTGWSVGHSAGTVTATRASLAVGAAPTITITVTPTNADDTLSTTADADADNAPAATQDVESTTIVGQTTLTIAISDSVDPVISHDNFDYSVVVTNTGANPATNVSASIVLDSSLTYVSGSGTGWSVGHSAGTVTCTRASLAVGAAPTITITVTSADAASTETTTADVDSDNSPAATQDSETTVVQLVTRDATKGWRRPATSTELDNLMTSISQPSPNNAWKCTEGSGNLVDLYAGFNLVASVTPIYGASGTGWATTGVAGTDNTSDGFRVASGTGPNPNTTSQTWMFVLSIEVEPTAARTFGGVVTAVQLAFVPAAGTNKLRITCAGVAVDGTADHAVGSYIFFARYDRAVSAVKALSDIETVVGTYSAATADNTKGLFPATTAPGSVTCFYIALWTGSNAEALSDADIAAIRSRFQS